MDGKKHQQQQQEQEQHQNVCVTASKINWHSQYSRLCAAFIVDDLRFILCIHLIFHTLLQCVTGELKCVP